MSWLRLPLVHFLAGGAILFGLVHVGRSSAPDARVDRVVSITAADIGLLRAAYTRDTGFTPTSADEVALIDRTIDEELLFREALARGLDRHDRSIRSWLVEQMRAVTEDHEANADELYAQARTLELDQKDLVVRRILVQKMRLLAARADERAPTDDELRAFYAGHEADYRQPDRLTFRQVFVRSGADANARAAELLADLRSRPAEAAVRHGDPFPLASRLTLQARSQVERLFGAAFAEAVDRVEPGSWSGPIVSPYGVHLVLVEAREPGVLPPLDAVRSRVLERWRDERHAQRLADLMERLRGDYRLEVESAAWQQRRHA